MTTVRETAAQANARRLQEFTTDELVAEVERRSAAGEVVVQALAAAITCPQCGRTSWHPGDVAAGYCGACHKVTNGPVTRACIRCEGCGKVANTEQAEPWTAWERLPMPSRLAVELKLVQPVPCPGCGGTGWKPA